MKNIVEPIYIEGKKLIEKRGIAKIIIDPTVLLL